MIIFLYASNQDLSMQFSQGKRNKGCLVIKLSSYIINLSLHDEISECLIVCSLNKGNNTSEPFAILLKSLDDSSFNRLVLDAVQLYIFLILTPTFFESIPSERSLKAAFQLYSMNCINSLRDM